jgi:hypothetical protein
MPSKGRNEQLLFSSQSSPWKVSRRRVIQAVLEADGPVTSTGEVSPDF